MNKNFIDLKKIDPAVAAMLDNSQQKMAERRLPHEQRKALIREREKAAKRKEKRIGLDLDPEIIHQVKRLAEKNGTTASQVAQLGLRMFLLAVQKGELDIGDYRVPCDNPRYDYMLADHKTGV